MTNKNTEHSKIILGIESSCDETAAAIVQKLGNGVKILSNIVASSADLQAKYGGVVPEQAAREQLKSIIPVIKEAIHQSQLTIHDIDAIAVTQGPGLIGSLLVGVEAAKVLSLIWNKPLVPVNHLVGHFYANWIEDPGNGISSKYYGGKVNKNTLNTKYIFPVPTFPAIGLLVSGGHTDLILMKDHGVYEYLGGTRDDAAGEAFDKTARLLGLPYPGGPVIAKLAEQGNPKAFDLPRPMIHSGDFDFSFSGLKTAISQIVALNRDEIDKQAGSKFIKDLAASIQEAIVDVLVKKTVGAAQTHNIDQIVVAGGVAANQTLSEFLARAVLSVTPHIKLSIPSPKFCTDNAVYIATAAIFNYHPTENPLTIQANPNLSLAR